MKATITKFVSKKGIMTKTLILAGLILISLPSCKHHSGGCDAYQGSGSGTRSVKHKQRHAEVLTVRESNNKA